MIEQVRTVEEINERIRNGDANVVTASEMKGIVSELGAEKAVYEVDVVTTGTFGAMCSSGMWMNFGHSEPPMKMSRVWLNDIEAYAGVAAVDAYIGATQLSETHGMAYGGGHVIEDLLDGKAVHLRAEAYGTDCYPRTELSVEITLDEMNQAILSNPRNGYERYAVAVNSSGKPIYTYMGKLLPDFGNATFSGAGEIAPILNDPNYRTIGLGTRIFLGGGQGYIVGSGTQHSPMTGFGTLMVQGNAKDMSPEFIKGATMAKYGTTLFVGLGVPIPVLDADIARSTGISDDAIVTNVYDYSQPTRSRKSLKQVSYAELKSGAIEISGREIRTAPISSFRVAERIGLELKSEILSGRFFLTSPVITLPNQEACNSMAQREARQHSLKVRLPPTVPHGQFVNRMAERCVHCGLCTTYCKAGVFQLDEDGFISDNPQLCAECGECVDICPHNAIGIKQGGGFS